MQRRLYPASTESDDTRAMIDGFAILLTHGLMLLAAWKMLSRPDLDREDGAEPVTMRRLRSK